MQLHLALVLAVLFGLSFSGFAQIGQPQLQYSSASILGAANDTVFYAHSPKALLVLDYTSGELQMRLDSKTILEDDREIQYAFNALEESTVVFRAQLGSIFELYKQENSGQIYSMSGYLTLNGQTKEVHGEYTVAKISAGVRNSEGNSDQLPLRMNIIVSFDPNDFGLGKLLKFSDPLELGMTNAIANRIN